MSLALSSSEARRRFLVLVALRWLSTGLVIPVSVLLMLSRGLSLGEVGVATAMQGVVAFVLELPTGGLADSLGRRRVLLAAAVFAAASYTVMVVATSVLAFGVAWALQGVFRALESGPLESWYVDTAQADDPDCDIESTMAWRGTVLGVAIGTGTLMSSGLIEVGSATPFDPLTVPIIVAIALVGVEMLLIARLLCELPNFARHDLRSTLRQVPRVVRNAVSVVRSTSALGVLVTVEVLWGFGIPAFELLTPARLEQLVGSTDRAAQALGPTQAAAWLGSAAGAAIVPWIGSRIGLPRTGAMMLATQALFVAGIALVSGPAGLVIAFVLTVTVHGGANAAHSGLLHRAVVGPDHRASVVSVNSLCGLIGGTVGTITLATLGDASNLSVAILTGATAIAASAVLIMRVRPHVDSRTKPAQLFSA